MFWLYTYPLHPEHVHLSHRTAGSQYPLLQPLLLQNELHAASLVGQWNPAMTTFVETKKKVQFLLIFRLLKLYA